MNSRLNQIDATLAVLVAQTAANGAAIEALTTDVGEIRDDLDTLTAQVVDLKVETAEIKGRVENIEFRLENIEGRVASIESRVTNIETRVANIERQLPDFESAGSRLDNLERGQADLKVLVDALASAE